jgi:hypothetical protein
LLIISGVAIAIIEIGPASSTFLIKSSLPTKSALNHGISLSFALSENQHTHLFAKAIEDQG